MSHSVISHLHSAFNKGKIELSKLKNHAPQSAHTNHEKKLQQTSFAIFPFTKAKVCNTVALKTSNISLKSGKLLKDSANK